MSTKNRPAGSRPRVLLAKAGLDGHDRGVKIIAQALRDAGAEVIYTGLRQTPAAIALAAVQEDADLVALSILSGAHMSVVPRIQKELKRLGRGDIKMVVGGIIPENDQKALLKLGIKRVFGPGDPVGEIVRYILRLTCGSASAMRRRKRPGNRAKNRV